MKTAQSILSQFEKTAGVWLASLSQYSEEQFAKKPNADSWSIGQVYNHLVVGARLYHIQQIAQCLEDKQTEGNVGKKFSGKHPANAYQSSAFGNIYAQTAAEYRDDENGFGKAHKNNA
jgi:uncharacterized damage-inducible protein DinB